jgi:hypothetical protein
LSGILSLRPSLTYLDKSDKTAKAEGRPRLVESSQDEEEEDDPKIEAVQRVGVRFLKGSSADSDRAQKRREKSFEYQQKVAREEPWTTTEFHHVKSEKWREESQKLFCKHMDDEAIVGLPNQNEYLSQLKDS